MTLDAWRRRASELALALMDERHYTDVSLAIAAADTPTMMADVMWEIRRVQAFQPRPASLRTQALRAQMWAFAS